MTVKGSPHEHWGGWQASWETVTAISAFVRAGRRVVRTSHAIGPHPSQRSISVAFFFDLWHNSAQYRPTYVACGVFKRCSHARRRTSRPTVSTEWISHCGRHTYIEIWYIALCRNNNACYQVILLHCAVSNRPYVNSLYITLFRFLSPHCKRS